MERVSQPSAREETSVPSLAALEPAGPVVGFAALAASARGEGGAPAGLALERALATLPPDEAQVSALLELLEAGGLNELTTSSGVPLRARAIEAVLALGYPFSLHLAPEELAWYRAWQRGPGRLRLWILLGILGAEVLAVLAFRLAF